MVTVMAEKGTQLGGEQPIPRNIVDIDDMKKTITEQIEACGVPFPISNKNDLANIYPYGTPMKCRVGGAERSIHDIIKDLDDRDFPLNTAGDVATLLTSKCDVFPKEE
jgi:hypothetical protein